MSKKDTFGNVLDIAFYLVLFGFLISSIVFAVRISKEEKDMKKEDKHKDKVSKSRVGPPGLVGGICSGGMKVPPPSFFSRLFRDKCNCIKQYGGECDEYDCEAPCSDAAAKYSCDKDACLNYCNDLWENNYRVQNQCY